MNFRSVGLFALFGILSFVMPAVAAANDRCDETRSLPTFHGVSNSGSIVVEIIFGQTESVRLSGNDDLIKEIETVVEGGVLKIRYRNNRQDHRRGTVTAYVTARRLDALTQSGSGSIAVKGPVTTDKFDVVLSGSGLLAFIANVAECNTSVSGSGRITAGGSAKSASVSVSGSGRFTGESLKSQSANLRVSGSGSITIHAEEQLDAVISGSGNIRYAGNPRTHIVTSGSGRVQRL